MVESTDTSQTGRITSVSHWNLTKRVDFEYREHFALCHGELIRRLEWRTSVSYRWCLSRDWQWSRTPTCETRPMRHVGLRWSARCIETCSHPISIPSTRKLLLIGLHLDRPRISGDTVTIILTVCVTSRRHRLTSASAYGTDASLPTVTPGIYLPHPTTTEPSCQLLCFNRRDWLRVTSTKKI